MAFLDEIILSMQELTRDEFVAGHNHGYLLVEPGNSEENSQWSFTTRSIASYQANLVRTMMEKGLTMSPELAGYQAFALIKSEGNPWRERVSVGRARNNDVVLPDPSVSKVHAYFSIPSEPPQLRDAGSRNGTKLNDSRLEPGKPAPLHSGDTIVFGAVAAVYLSAADLFDFVEDKLSPSDAPP